MNNHNPYHTKAEAYARYRWDYEPEAIQVIFDHTRLSRLTCVADIGSGTGMLARHFAGQVASLNCVEPDAEMQRQAQALLSTFPAFHPIIGMAEATGLADHCIDLITVGQAIHWFQPQAARREFRRILKPGGWLAIFWNQCLTQELNHAYSEIFIEKNGRQVSQQLGAGEPVGSYFQGDYLQLRYTMEIAETWERFFGGLVSDSQALLPTHPGYPSFVSAAEKVFERLSVSGILRVNYATMLCLGHG